MYSALNQGLALAFQCECPCRFSLRSSGLDGGLLGLVCSPKGFQFGLARYRRHKALTLDFLIEGDGRHPLSSLHYGGPFATRRD